MLIKFKDNFVIEKQNILFQLLKEQRKVLKKKKFFFNYSEKTFFRVNSPFFPCILFSKKIQYEQIPKDKRKKFYAISCPANLLHARAKH